MTDDLVAFLRARLKDDEDAALAATSGPWTASLVSPSDDEWRIREAANDWSAEDVVGPGYEGGGVWRAEDATHIVRWDPQRVIGEVAAKRAILARHTPNMRWATATAPRPCDGCGYTGPCDDPVTGDIGDCPELRDLAAVYAGHPDYQEAWKP